MAHIIQKEKKQKKKKSKDLLFYGLPSRDFSKIESNLNIAFYQGKKLRLFKEEKLVWCVAKDLSEILGVSESRKVINELEEDHWAYMPVEDTAGRKQRMYVVNEFGLYSLALGNGMKDFKRWFIHEVFPYIRVKGEYNTSMTFNEVVDRAYELRSHLISEKSKGRYYNNIFGSDSSQTMNQVAKVLGVGRNKLFKFLREKKVLMNDNLPYQKYIENNHFDVVETFVYENGNTQLKPKTVVTPMGLKYIDKLLKQKHK